MKKRFYSAIILFSLIFYSMLIYSCKNTTETKLAYTESDTIKKSVKEKEQDITWTQEMENGRLSEKITRSAVKIGPDVIYNKEFFKISSGKKNPVYPELLDFGSLDTRNLSSSVKDKLNKFCSSISSENHTGADAYFARKYIFNYVFFVQALENGWKINFNQDYPHKKTESESESETEEGIFTKWLFGEPFIGTEIIQIPVRFYASCGIIDVTIYLNSSGNNEIYQITINRWKKV